MAKPRKALLSSRRNRYGYLFTLPWIVGLAVFVLYPVVEAVRISFAKLQVVETGYALPFVGWENYRYIFLVNTSYRQLLLQSLGKMLYSVVLVLIFSFFLASVLNMRFRGRGAVRSILFLPVIFTSGAIDKLMASDYMATVSDATAKSSGSELAGGFMNMIADFDMPPALVGFMESAVSQIYDITVMSAVPLVIFIAALHAIPDSLYEAAYIEGASAWEVYWKIKFPLVSPHILVCIVYCIIDSLNNAANPVIALIKKTTYEDIRYGYGAAMSLAYTVVTLVVVFLVYKIVSRWIVYSE